VTSFDALITGDEFNSAVDRAFELQIARGMARRMHDAIYSAGLALFIYGITSAKRTREVQAAVLVRESSTQLSIYIHWIHASDTLHTYRSSSLRKAPWRP
jgi:hypothetical protein